MTLYTSVSAVITGAFSYFSDVFTPAFFFVEFPVLLHPVRQSDIKARIMANNLMFSTLHIYVKYMISD